MDSRMRQAIFDSHERGIRLLAQVESGHADTVPVSRAELHALIIEHALVCGFALGSSPLEAEVGERS